jgi:hypothetical protein
VLPLGYICSCFYNNYCSNNFEKLTRRNAVNPDKLKKEIQAGASAAGALGKMLFSISQLKLFLQVAGT